MKAKIFIVLLVLLQIALCACGTRKKVGDKEDNTPRSFFDYENCVFVGKHGLRKTAKPEENNGYSIMLIAAGTPVKILDWNRDEGVHVISKTDDSEGWCDCYELEFQTDVLDYLSDFVFKGDEIVKDIILQTKFERLSEINGGLIKLFELSGIEQYDNNFWNALYYHLINEKIKVNDLENIEGMPCIYLKCIDFVAPDWVLDYIDQIPYKPMGENAETPLIYAVRKGIKKYFEFAIEKEWDLTVKDKFGKDVFDYAKEKGFTEIANAKCSSFKAADYEEIAKNWEDFAPEYPMTALNEPKTRRFYNSEKLDVQFCKEDLNDELNYLEEKTKIDFDENNLSVYSLWIERYSIQNQFLITSNKEKIPVSLLEPLKTIVWLPYKHSVKIGGKTISSQFLLVQKKDGRFGMIDSLLLAHRCSKKTDWGTLLATLFCTGNGDDHKAYIGNLFLVEENLLEDGKSTQIATRQIFLDDMIEQLNENIFTTTYLYLGITESKKLLVCLERDFDSYKQGDGYNFGLLNKNVYILNDDKLSHLFTLNSNDTTTFADWLPNHFGVDGGEEFKEKYEIWRFDDDGEIDSHFFLNNSNEYDDFLNHRENRENRGNAEAEEYIEFHDVSDNR